MKKLILSLGVTIVLLAALLVGFASTNTTTDAAHAASVNSGTVAHTNNTAVQKAPANQKNVPNSWWCGFFGSCPSVQLMFICSSMHYATVTGDNQWNRSVTWSSGYLNGNSTFTTNGWWWEDDTTVTIHWTNFQGSGTSYAYITPYNHQNFSLGWC